VVQCPDCRDRSRATDLARNDWLIAQAKERLTLQDSVRPILGSRLHLESIRSFGTCFALRYSIDCHLGDPVRGSGDVNPDPRVHGPWDALDDFGGEYRGIGQAYQGSADHMHGDVWFAPSLHPATKLLTLTAFNRGKPLFVTTARLGPPAPFLPDSLRPGDSGFPPLP
jgi:hypothetical protein